MGVTVNDLRFNIVKFFAILSKKEDIAFGIWSDRDEDIDNMVREIRKGFIQKEFEAKAKMREATYEAKSDTITGALQYILNEEQDNIPNKYKHFSKQEG